jgi:[ribulose-bisphosphate carboxylase]-lysine N-methyltransferase
MTNQCKSKQIRIWRLLVASLLVAAPPLAQCFLPAALGPQRSFVLRPMSMSMSMSTDTNNNAAADADAAAAADAASLETVSRDLETSFAACQKEIAKTWRVKVAPVTDRLGLIATQNINKGDVIMAMPNDDRFVLTGKIAKETVFKDVLSDAYDSYSWTGETGLIALMILNEVARAAGTDAGVALPVRPAPLQTMITSWVNALPSPHEMASHPFMWPEQDQEILQSSSTNKIYRRLDDLEEDCAWLTENVFDKDRARFPESVTWNTDKSKNDGSDGDSTIPCFTLQGLKWAMALALSRTSFVDGSLRLIPVMDMCNHADECNEVQVGFMGAFGTTKGVQLLATKPYKAGEQVFCSYGPKSAADYLMEHGFCPEQCWKTAVSELTFEIEAEDRFRDDKLDILENDTYDQAPMDPVQSFDVVSAVGRDSAPDPAMMQFVRFCKLGSMDAFLLESIFRSEVWGFMELPVSEVNELQVVRTICEVCERALNDLQDCPPGGPEICTKLRESETQALTRSLEYLKREQEALDLKEYYQERRLKDLGLNSDWSPEEDDPSLDFGQTRAPGGADYDW